MSNKSTQFKKGNQAAKGNPKSGRPRNIPGLEQLLNEVLGEEQNNMTGMEAIIKALRNKAIKGDVRAAEILLDRAYGKVTQSLEHSGGVTLIPPGSTLQISQADADEAVNDK